MRLTKLVFSFLLLFNIFSCSEEAILEPDVETPDAEAPDSEEPEPIVSNELDFIVFTQDLLQLNITETGEISELNLKSEFGIENGPIPLPIHIMDDFFIYNDEKKLHVKNLISNEGTTIENLCDVSLESLLEIPVATSTDDKLVLFSRAADDNYFVTTINKDLNADSCQNLSLGNDSFSEGIQNNFFSSTTHILYEKFLGNKIYIYSYNTDLNELQSIVYDELFDPSSSRETLVMDEEQFHLFSSRMYKTYDYRFNFIEEKNFEDFFTPIRGTQIEDNKIEGEVFTTATTGFFSRPNVFDINENKLLLDQEAVNNIFDTLSADGLIMTYEVDLKKDRIIYGVRLTNSQFLGKIVITDFDSIVIDEFFIDSFPSIIHAL